MSLESRIKAAIRDVPDFPREGILFKDVTTLLLHPELSNQVLDALAGSYAGVALDAVAGIESRGFLSGNALALRLGKPFVMIRKAGKLPAEKISHSYDLEYGSATIEMHRDAVSPGQRALVHDAGAHVAGFSFLVELGFLAGRQRLAPIQADIRSLAVY